ncbi:hypothetical protein [Amycolatopsis sp. w19]|uniref:hypothetical protein n=1 Tax=Amycolatopsis sp. w19 TaxID=3448134 RepID=UPI003F1CF4AC
MQEDLARAHRLAMVVAEQIVRRAVVGECGRSHTIVELHHGDGRRIPCSGQDSGVVGEFLPGTDAADLQIRVRARARDVRDAGTHRGFPFPCRQFDGAERHVGGIRTGPPREGAAGQTQLERGEGETVLHLIRRETRVRDDVEDTGITFDTAVGDHQIGCFRNGHPVGAAMQVAGMFGEVRLDAFGKPGIHGLTVRS